VIGILETIIADKRIEIEARKVQTSLDQLKQQISSLDKCRNFFKAVTKTNKRRLNVIAEVKKASPSAGVIREDFEPVEIAKVYESCGADAISVLTDEKYFQGRLEYLSAVKKAVSVPVLRKDFIIDPWQVYESRVAGADAILLIAEALPSGELTDLMILAAQLSLTVLLEVHEIDSLLRVRSLAGFPQAGYSVIGINNRNLATMEVDINTTSRLAELIEGQGFVSESGIKSREDVDKLIKIGASAILIGQTLCKSNLIEEKFRELFG
jgi:indole-3-glycerol phosphate synthase